MAPAPSSISSSVVLLFLFLCSEGSKGAAINGNDDHHGFVSVRVETLMPAAVCSMSEVPSGNSLMVTHRYGPCSPESAGDASEEPDRRQQSLLMSSKDSARIAYLQTRVQPPPPAAASTGAATGGGGNTSTDGLSASATMRASAGSVIGSDGYTVTVAIGTRNQSSTLLFDTGSDICWVQCAPCQQCYTQRGPLFVPAGSTTYRRIPFNALECTKLRPQDRGRSGNDCIYTIRYADNSFSSGFLAKDRWVLTPSTAAGTIPNFVFGCGQRNAGFAGVAGVLGLGRGFHSLPSQTSRVMGGVFSYCLPTSASSTGHLTLGRSTARSPKYTTMLPHAVVYVVKMTGISVAGRSLNVGSLLQQQRGALIDSGAMVTYLPGAVYTALRSEFRRLMSAKGYQPSGVTFGPMDTCYDFSRTADRSMVPIITLHFTGSFFRGVSLQLTATQMLSTVNPRLVCLAFAASRNPAVPTIIGSTQQRGMEVIFDLARRRIGFAPGRC